jgi:hypothetical protein
MFSAGLIVGYLPSGLLKDQFEKFGGAINMLACFFIAPLTEGPINATIYS